MADIVDPMTRSRMMASIKGTNTAPEIALRKALHALGLRYRLHDRKLPGRPNIVLPRWRSVVFVHGCFWHRHEGCRFATVPATRPEFWSKKFRDNVARDQRNLERLVDAGWQVAIVWECDLKSQGAPAIASELMSWLRSEGPRHHDMTPA